MQLEQCCCAQDFSKIYKSERHTIPLPQSSFRLIHFFSFQLVEDYLFIILPHNQLVNLATSSIKMRFSFISYVVSALALLSPLAVKANTPFSDSFVQNDIAVNKGYEIAWASRP